MHRVSVVFSFVLCFLFFFFFCCFSFSSTTENKPPLQTQHPFLFVFVFFCFPVFLFSRSSYVSLLLFFSFCCSSATRWSAALVVGGPVPPSKSPARRWLGRCCLALTVCSAVWGVPAWKPWTSSQETRLHGSGSHRARRFASVGHQTKPSAVAQTVWWRLGGSIPVKTLHPVPMMPWTVVDSLLSCDGHLGN